MSFHLSGASYPKSIISLHNREWWIRKKLHLFDAERKLDNRDENKGEIGNYTYIATVLAIRWMLKATSKSFWLQQEFSLSRVILVLSRVC